MTTKIIDEFSNLPTKQAFYRRNKHRGVYLLYAAKARAKRLGLPFNLTHDDIVIPAICPVLGISIDMDVHGHGGSFRPNSPSIDRLIPELGYTKDNIRVISFQANRYKSNMSRDTLQKLLDYMDGKL